MTNLIGIDLGTTFSAIATLNDLGKPEVLEDPIYNKKTIPSVVFLKGENNVEVGENAKKMLAVDSNKTVSEIKKRMHEEVIWSTKEGKWKEFTYDPRFADNESLKIRETLMSCLTIFNDSYKCLAPDKRTKSVDLLQARHGTIV